MEIYVTMLIKSTADFREKYKINPNEICYDKKHCAFICTVRIEKTMIVEFNQDENVLYVEGAHNLIPVTETIVLNEF